MKAHWWSCVLGLLCMPAEVLLNNLAASQNPSTISLLRVNSSLETTCFTSLSNPLSLTLRRQFQNEEVVHLHFKNEQIKKTTTAQKFVGRVHITEELQVKSAISLQLSQLGLEDTDLYYCRWTLLKSANLVTVTSNGTIIIVRESAPQDQCEDTILDLTLISLSVTALSVTLSLFIGALIFKCKRFKKHFKPARVVRPPRPERAQHICPRQQPQYRPYLVTSLNNPNSRGIQ